MYPFRADNVYLKNCWYVAALPSEIAQGPIERMIMDEPIALFRTESGEPAALYGICPHRFYPLAQGRVVGNAIECGYHGFQFDGHSGSCVRIPSQTASPKGFCQKTYPVIEHGPWIWIWPGDPKLADPALLPDLAEFGLGPNSISDSYAVVRTEGRAQLLIENVFDLTHVGFLHGVEVDGSSLVNDHVEIREDGDRFIAARPHRANWKPGFYDLLFGPDKRFPGEHDSNTYSVFHSAAYSITNTGDITWIEGHQEVDRSIYGTVTFHHPITPETQHSCHYFMTNSRDYRHEDVAFTKKMSELDYRIRMQDVVAAGLIERNIRDYGLGERELLARADTASIRLRRRMQSDLDQAMPAPPPAAALAATSAI